MFYINRRIPLRQPVQNTRLRTSVELLLVFPPSEDFLRVYVAPRNTYRSISITSWHHVDFTIKRWLKSYSRAATATNCIFKIRRTFLANLRGPEVKKTSVISTLSVGQRNSILSRNIRRPGNFYISHWSTGCISFHCRTATGIFFNSICKCLYERLFDYFIFHLQRSLSADKSWEILE